MRLFKNVDLCDLESILEKGILSLDKCNNDNWHSRKRASNSTDKVYLFAPTTNQNAFPKYGIVLLEVEAEATKSEISEHDAYYDKYEEYICDYVKPENIIAAYIPEIFKDKVAIRSNKIRYVKISADYYDEDNGTTEMQPCPDFVLQRFAATAPYENSMDFNFFRGITEKRHMIDLYNIRYQKEDW